jgi:transcriptional antiterminator NusG
MSTAFEWFAIRVKSNRERVSAMGLTGKGYEVFLPELQDRSDSRSVPALRPLFPGYLFCRFNVEWRLPILTLPSIVHIVGVGKKPIPIEAEEIESLRILIQSRLEIDPNECFTPGQRVKVVRGPLIGASGVVTGFDDRHKLCLSITLLQRSLSVALSPEWLSISN